MKAKISNNIKISVIITIIISLVAIIISIRSCQISSKSSDSADEANRIAVAVAKPTLALDVNKFEDGSFIQVEKKSESRAIITFDFNIQNTGNIGIKNIRLPKVIAFDKAKPVDDFYMKNLSEKSYLAPGKGHNIAIQTDIGMVDLGTIDNYLERIEQNRISFKHRMQVIFVSDLEPNIEYSVYALYEIYKNEVIIIESGTTNSPIESGN